MTVHVVRALDLCLAVAERQERLDRLAAESCPKTYGDSQNEVVCAADAGLVEIHAPSFKR